MSSALNLLELAHAALKFAHALSEVDRCKRALSDGYAAWRNATGYREHVAKGSPEWIAMMAATDGEYRALERAKARERRARTALRAAAREVEQ
ncbi:MAG: hypothetical protein QM569_09730 [Acidovorax sp.]|uniref:hypothetical protein n=1 Tax=Acidovorax sp. TaxID=1872122 RepID=UPI0039E51B7F